MANPRRTELCRYGGPWLGYRPGSEVALLNGLARAILDTGPEGGVVARKSRQPPVSPTWRSCERGCEPYGPEQVERACWGSCRDAPAGHGDPGSSAETGYSLWTRLGARGEQPLPISRRWRTWSSCLVASRLGLWPKTTTPWVRWRWAWCPISIPGGQVAQRQQGTQPSGELLGGQALAGRGTRL